MASAKTLLLGQGESGEWVSDGRRPASSSGEAQEKRRRILTRIWHVAFYRRFWILMVHGQNEKPTPYYKVSYKVIKPMIF